MKQNEVKIFRFDWMDQAYSTISTMIRDGWQVLSAQHDSNGDWIVVFWK